jgi:hypothetical protein
MRSCFENKGMKGQGRWWVHCGSDLNGHRAVNARNDSTTKARSRNVSKGVILEGKNW